MSSVRIHTTLKEKRKRRVRGKMHGTAKRPRLTVYRSNKHLFLQVIDDDKGITLVSATDMGKKSKLKGTKTEKAAELGKALAAEMKKKKVTAVVFDRGSYKYHGRVKAVAEAVREGGIQV